MSRRALGNHVQHYRPLPHAFSPRAPDRGRDVSHRVNTVWRVNPKRLLTRLRRGQFANVRFNDAVRLVEAVGYRSARVRGSHHIFMHPEVPDLLNLQDVRGEAKPYQLRQVLRTIEEYNLDIEA